MTSDHKEPLPEKGLESDLGPIDDFATGFGHAAKDVGLGVVHLVKQTVEAAKEVIMDEPYARDAAWETAKSMAKDANTILNPAASDEDKAELSMRILDSAKNFAKGIEAKAKEEYQQGGAAQVSGYISFHAVVVALTRGCGEEAEATTPLRMNPSTPLKFGENDLVYGPSANGELRLLQQRSGGKLLSDYEKPPELSFDEFTTQTLDEAAASGRQVNFDLSHMKDVDELLAGEGKYANSVTSVELRHIRDNWQTFKVKPKFFKDGVEVSPPFKTE